MWHTHTNARIQRVKSERPRLGFRFQHRLKVRGLERARVRALEVLQSLDVRLMTLLRLQQLLHLGFDLKNKKVEVVEGRLGGGALKFKKKKKKTLGCLAVVKVVAT